MTIYERIRELREKRGLSQEELALALGYTSRSTVNKVEKGMRDISQSMILKYAEALHTTPGYLLFGEEEDRFSSIPAFVGIEPITKRRIPVLGSIACGEPIYMDEDRESYIASGTNIRADFCLRAKGDSMVNARIYDGDIVFIEAMEAVDNGCIAAVAVGDEATLKRVFYYPESNKLILQAENPKYAPIIIEGEELDTVRILGRAVAFQSDVR